VEQLYIFYDINEEKITIRKYGKRPLRKNGIASRIKKTI